MADVIKDDELKEAIATNLNELLEARGMSRYRLAQLTGESEQTIRNVADGLHVPRSGILARIAEACGVKIDRLIRVKKESWKKLQKVAP